jgi:hypothetical protein
LSFEIRCPEPAERTCEVPPSHCGHARNDLNFVYT